MLLRLTLLSDEPADLSDVPWDRIFDLSAAELSATQIRVGRHPRSLSDYFRIDFDSSPSGEGKVCQIHGAHGRLHGVGSRWSAGELIIHGDLGHNCGRQMTGGRVIIHGNVGDQAGLAMKGGTLEIRGNCGALLGGPLPGHSAGMRGGEIFVTGSAGDRVGTHLRRGLIVIAGDVASTCGLDALAGTIMVLGNVGPEPGIGMKRATLILCRGTDSVDLRRYSPAETSQPIWLRILFKHLSNSGVDLPPGVQNATWLRLTGDRLALHKGEIYAPAAISAAN